MNCVNFLYISFCLFLNTSILYPSEKENATKKPCSDKNSKNPLMRMETYKDNSGNFTLDNAKRIATETPSRDLCYLFHWPKDNVVLEWACSRQNPLSEEERLKIAKLFLQKDTFNPSKKEALLACLRNKGRNSKIITLLKNRISPRKDTEQDSSD